MNKIYHLAYGLCGLFLLQMLLTTGKNDGRVFDIMQQNYYFSAEKTYTTGCLEVINMYESDETLDRKEYIAECKRRAAEYRKELEAATRL